MGKIILLNGPPSSGKDTAAKHIRQWLNDTERKEESNWRCLLDRMSMPIKRAFAGTMGLPITEDGIVEPWESKKEEPIPEFGVSYRQWQIDFSERFLKTYNNRIFGFLAASRIERRFQKGIANLMVIPDCGFSIEIEVFYNWKDWNRDDILLVRCHRPGFTFEGDSREYVKAPPGSFVFDPFNNSTKASFLEQIEAGVRCWLETPERMPREQ